VLNPNTAVSLYFMVFGGNWIGAFFRPVTDFSLRIRIDISTTGVHTFGDWEVETMPGW
jgi:hypothetical protein